MTLGYNPPLHFGSPLYGGTEVRRWSYEVRLRRLRNKRDSLSTREGGFPEAPLLARSAARRGVGVRFSTRL